MGSVGGAGEVAGQGQQQRTTHSDQGCHRHRPAARCPATATGRGDRRRSHCHLFHIAAGPSNLDRAWSPWRQRRVGARRPGYGLGDRRDPTGADVPVPVSAGDGEGDARGGEGRSVQDPHRGNRAVGPRSVATRDRAGAGPVAARHHRLVRLPAPVRHRRVRPLRACGAAPATVAPAPARIPGPRPRRLHPPPTPALRLPLCLRRPGRDRPRRAGDQLRRIGNRTDGRRGGPTAHRLPGGGGRDPHHRPLRHLRRRRCVLVGARRAVRTGGRRRGRGAASASSSSSSRPSSGPPC